MSLLLGVRVVVKNIKSNRGGLEKGEIFSGFQGFWSKGCQSRKLHSLAQNRPYDTLTCLLSMARMKSPTVSEKSSLSERGFKKESIVRSAKSALPKEEQYEQKYESYRMPPTMERTIDDIEPAVPIGQWAALLFVILFAAYMLKSRKSSSDVVAARSSSRKQSNKEPELELDWLDEGEVQGSAMKGKKAKGEKSPKKKNSPKKKKKEKEKKESSGGGKGERSGGRALVSTEGGKFVEGGKSVGGGKSVKSGMSGRRE